MKTIKNNIKRKNKGESLVESLISMFFIITVLVPVSDIFLKTFKISIKADKKNYINSENRNMIEIFKIKKYDEILSLTGKYTVKDLTDFYNKFSIQEKYRVLNEKSVDSKSKEIEIRRTEDYYINERGDKDYIFEIIVESVKGYYFPN
jgi:hypothetical protein